MSHQPEPRRTGVTVDMHLRVLNVIRSHSGRATIQQIRDAEVVPGALVQETLRELISRKALSMIGVGTYVLADSHRAESAKLVGPPAVESTEQSGRNPSDDAHTAGGPAEPGPRRRGRAKKQGGTPSPSRPIECVRCHCQFPPIEFVADTLSRRRFRLCKNCRAAKAAGMRKPKTLAQLVDRYAPETREQHVKLAVNGVILEHLDTLLNTGLHGRTLEQVAERLICDALARLIVGGILKQATGERA